MSTENIVGEYISAHPESQKLHQRAEQHFATNGVTHYARLFEPFLPYMTHAEGVRTFDVDGHNYIDYSMGHGALILGHNHPDVVAAVQEQMAKGVHFGSNHQLEIEWAELIKQMLPAAERVEFFACGQEANMLAIRIARAYTGRKKVLRFENTTFHGWGDELLAPGSFGVASTEVNGTAAHDLESLERELATGEYALLMTEGGGAFMAGQVPWEPDFVRKMRDLTTKYGTVWLIDEVVTGFRDAPGGWQSTIEVTPDLTTLGKCVAGGLAAGALAGKAEVMDVLKPKDTPYLRHTGTWNSMPLVAAAGIAACKHYLSGKVQRRVNELGNYLRAKGNQLFKDKGISGRLYGRSIIHIYFGPIDFEPADDRLPPTKSVRNLTTGEKTELRLCLHLLQRGVSTMKGRFFILSAAHTEADIDQTIAALADTIDAMITEGNLLKACESTDMA